MTSTEEYIVKLNRELTKQINIRTTENLNLQKDYININLENEMITKRNKYLKSLQTKLTEMGKHQDYIIKLQNRLQIQYNEWVKLCLLNLNITCFLYTITDCVLLYNFLKDSNTLVFLLKIISSGGFFYYWYHNMYRGSINYENKIAVMLHNICTSTIELNNFMTNNNLCQEMMIY